MESYTHRRIHDMLVAAKRPVFVADERLDGDSLGSSLALADFLKARGVRVPVFVSEPVPAKYQFLPNVDLCTTDASVFDDPSVDLVVIFDCSDANYVERIYASRPPGLPASRPPLINIDHHASNSRFGEVNLVDSSAAATCEMLTRIRARFPDKTIDGVIDEADEAQYTYKLRAVVFDDGRRVFIEFAPTIDLSDLPPLYRVGPDGKAAELINYHVEARRLVVDRLFDRGELRLGGKRQAQAVRLTRLNPLTEASR